MCRCFQDWGEEQERVHSVEISSKVAVRGTSALSLY